MTLARRLIVLLSFPLLALAALGLLTYRQLATVEQKGQFVWNEQIPNLTALSELSRSVERMRLNIRDYLLAVDPAGQARAKSEFTTCEVRLERALNEYGEKRFS